MMNTIEGERKEKSELVSSVSRSKIFSIVCQTLLYECRYYNNTLWKPTNNNTRRYYDETLRARGTGIRPRHFQRRDVEFERRNWGHTWNSLKRLAQDRIIITLLMCLSSYATYRALIEDTQLTIYKIMPNYTIYTLLYGLTYNTRGYFASCVVFFRAPKGRGKMRAKSKMSARIVY